jgi:tetrahydromethanopterin S-methyltransferase subunit F
VTAYAAAASVRASDRTPPGESCGAAIQASQRLQREGRLQAARAGLAACLSAACPGPVRSECERRQATLAEAIPAVVLVAKDEASNDVTTVRVTMDGQPLVERIDGASISVDPGQHRFVFEAAGFRRMETTIMARERNKKIRVVAYLNAAMTPDLGGGGLRSASSLSQSSELSSEPSSEPSSQASWSAGRRRKLELGLGIAGVAGFAVGAIWGLKSKVTYDHALVTECDSDPARCSSQGIAGGHTAHQQATVATVGFLAAGVLISAAAAVYFTSPRQTQVAVAPSVADRSGGLAVVGKW